MALLDSPAMKDVQLMFTFFALVVSVLIIPYCVIALHAYEKNRKVRFIRRNPNARYWPSLFITTWLTRANGLGIAYIMTAFTIRAYFRFEQIGEVTPQPAWSYLMNMFGTAVILLILMLPATFLLWVKSEIRHLEHDEEREMRTPPNA